MVLMILLLLKFTTRRKKADEKQLYGYALWLMGFFSCVPIYGKFSVFLIIILLNQIPTEKYISLHIKNLVERGHGFRALTVLRKSLIINDFSCAWLKITGGSLCFKEISHTPHFKILFH